MNVKVIFESEAILVSLEKWDEDSKLPLFRLHEKLVCSIIIDGVIYRIVVPEGFVTDLASIPKFLHGIYDPGDPRWIKAAILHDFLYNNMGEVFSINIFVKFNRKICDLIYESGMKAGKTPWIHRLIHYRTIRIFGGSHFKCS